MAVLRAANNDHSNGYLFQLNQLVRAEVFDDILEQGEYLHEQGYYQAAGVLADAVLEDSLRKLCERNGISLDMTPKLDSMNAELAKKGVYSVLIQKRITSLADIRNKAAHGKWNDFSSSDVKDMLKHVRDFVTDYSV